MPATGRFSGTPASIIASEAPQTVAMEDEPFELRDLRHDADRVGENFALGQDRVDRPPGELAVSDFAPTRGAHPADFADRVGREVVMQEEGLFVRPFQRIDILLVLARAQGGDHQRLRLAAGEERAAMRAGQNANLAGDRPHRGEVASVDALVRLEDVAAHDVLLGFLEGARDLGGDLAVVVLGDERGLDLVLHRGNGVAALMLGDDLVGLAQVRFGIGATAASKLVRALGRASAPKAPSRRARRA